MTMLATADKQRLVNFLSNFYSIGQLQIIHCTLTDGAPIPGMTDFERSARIEAIETILQMDKNERLQQKDAEQPAPVMEVAKIPLAKAQRLARGLVDRLEEYCDKIYIAGSIRRQKAEVKDIEIVCLPKTFVEADFSLFGSGSTETKVIPAFIREVDSIGLSVIKGQPTGRYMQIEAFKGIKLDLFMPTPADFYRQLAIRTGSAEYAAKVIATGWKNLGWCGTPDGLRRMSQCEETKSGGWKCTSKTPMLPPAWQSEAEFFDWLKVPFKEPKDRH